MPDIRCAVCDVDSQFDPKAVWTSPGKMQGPQPGIPASVVIQCPHCKQWTRVMIKGGDDGAH